MCEDFIISGEYQGYVYVGHAEGRFDAQDNDGNTVKRDYYNMYVICPVSNYVSEDYKASGMKAEKKSCVSPDVWRDLKPGDRVKLFFDDKKRVVMAAIDQ